MQRIVLQLPMLWQDKLLTARSGFTNEIFIWEWSSYSCTSTVWKCVILSNAVEPEQQSTLSSPVSEPMLARWTRCWGSRITSKLAWKPSVPCHMKWGSHKCWFFKNVLLTTPIFCFRCHIISICKDECDMFIKIKFHKVNSIDTCHFIAIKEYKIDFF